MNTANHQLVQRAGRREWIGLAVLALPTLLLSLDMNVLFIAMPFLGADLNPSSSQMLWIMDIYGFMIAGFLITMGTLGDRIGRRKLLMIGAVAFGIASLLAAFSTSAEMLIATRAILGIAGATLMPSTLALIRNMFQDDKQRGVAIAVWMSCFMVGAMIGPLVGGVLLEFFWWGSVFLLGVPVMILLLIAAPILLPEHQDAQPAKLDGISVALSLAFILPIIYGLKELSKGDMILIPLLSIGVGTCFCFWFLRRQRRLTTPLLDLRLFRNPSFRTALGIMWVGAFAMGGIFLFVTQYLQLIEGMSPIQAGLWTMPGIIAMLISSMAVPMLTPKIRPSYIVAISLAIAVIGFLILTQVSTGDLTTMVIGFALINFGIGPTGVIGTDLVVGSAPPEKAGSASSLSETSAELGIALGVALLGSIGTAVYRNQMTSLKAVTPEMNEVGLETLVNTVSFVEPLPAELAANILEHAHIAFLNGMNIAAGVSAFALTIFAVLSLVLLRHIPNNAASQTQEK